MKPLAPKDTPDVGGGITGPWSDPPEMIPLPGRPSTPFPVPIITDYPAPSPDLA